MNKMFTKEDAVSFIASEKTKEGRKWEAFIEAKLQKSNYLPPGDLVGSIFKTTKFSFKIDENDISGHQKLTDLYLPKFKHLIEGKTDLSDSTEQAIAFSIKSLMETKEYGDNFQFILLLDKQPAPAMLRRLKSRVNTYKNFRFYVGERGVSEYIEYLNGLEVSVQKSKLPMGNIEWVKFTDLVDNEKNRDINIPHVYDLVDSLLSQTRGGLAIRGLLRTFIGFKRNGKIHLVDAHHCRAACEMINKYTSYQIDEVPVYTLDHLEHLTEEEMTTLMSTINTLVLKWETFQYVKIWEKTFEAIGDAERLFPYRKLRESMEDVSAHLKQANANSAPIVQSFCLDGRADETNWQTNTKKINYGTLYFTPETYENKLKPIVSSVKKLADKIDGIREVVGGQYTYKNEIRKVPSKNVSILRAYATELSLQEKDRNNRERYYKSLKLLSNGYWNESELLPIETNIRLFEKEDWKSLSNFPTNGDEMKKFVNETLIPNVTKILKRKTN